jgi:hypothetical protein
MDVGREYRLRCVGCGVFMSIGVVRDCVWCGGKMEVVEVGDVWWCGVVEGEGGVWVSNEVKPL